MEKSRSLCIITSRNLKCCKLQIVDWFTWNLGTTFQFIELVYTNSYIETIADTITVEICKKVIIKYRGVEVLWFDSLDEMLGNPLEVIIVLSIVKTQLCVLVDTFDNLPNSEFWNSSIAQELSLCRTGCVKTSNKSIKVYNLRNLEIPNNQYKFRNITSDILLSYVTIPILYNSIQDLRTCGICCNTTLVFDSVCNKNHYYCTDCCSKLNTCPVCRGTKQTT